jgi:predicted small lipoprotein YifL
MRSAWFCLAMLVAVSGCGIKRPLIAPKDIPAYEEKQRKKREKQEEFKREQQQQQTPIAPQI